MKQLLSTIVTFPDTMDKTTTTPLQQTKINQLLMSPEYEMQSKNKYQNLSLNILNFEF